MKAILLLVLSVVILSQSYGFVYADHGGSSHATVTGGTIGASTVTVEIDSLSYEAGDTILVHGSISDYDESDPYKNFDVTLRVIGANGNIINISQLPLNSDGSYSVSIAAGGPLWKSSGDYTISVSHGSDRTASITFDFINVFYIVCF